ncbi:DNA polymerase I [Candidatus Dojkabacteria bacterium]|nr:DNA polymerase I [Candidatus Dojkabacteria bacterium]
MAKGLRGTILLIDSHALVHRAYHAFPPNIATTKGEQVNAVYGFTKLLLEVLEKFHPEYVVAAFDRKPTVRLSQYANYKAQRPEVDTELRNQFPRVKEIVKAFNIPILEVEGFEADDVIGTIVEKFNGGKYEKIIVTGDKDIFQLVDNDTKVYMSGGSFSQSQLYTAEEVKEKMGFGPDFVVDFKALKGDPSDNIPGVKGIGDKGATDLITKFGHLDNIYKNIEKVEPVGLKKKLQEGIEQAELSKMLATIDRNVPIEFDLREAELQDYNISEVKKLFQELEFRSLLVKLPKSKNGEEENTKEKERVGMRAEAFQHSMFTGMEIFPKEDRDREKPVNNSSRQGYIILSKKGVGKFISNLSTQEKYAFDTETTSLDFMEAKVVGMSFCFTENEAFYLPVKLITPEIKRKLKKIFENQKIKKIAHNIKYDMHILENFGITLKGVYFDTMIANYVLSGGNGRNGLKDLAFNHLGMELEDFESVFSSRARDFDIKNVDLETLGYYACADADATWKLYKKFVNELSQKSGKDGWNQTRLFYDIEMPTTKVLLRMERNGVKLNKDYLKNFKRTLEESIAKLRESIFKDVGHEFNIESPKQVGQVLFEELGLPGGKKTKTGGYSTDERILRDYKESHPMVPKLLDYRELSKLNSTYTDALIDCVNKHTGRIHTSYNQTIASTGRLSSTNPNLQNIPVATNIGQEIRKSFVADNKNILIAFDYSQQELRILAHLTKDKALEEAYKNGVDVHALTASKIFNKDLKDVTREERSSGKTINFSVIYGISAFGLSDRLKIERELAQEFINTYFETYPGVRDYFDRLLNEVGKKGFVETLYGRRRETSGLMSPNFRIRSATEREVINFPIQGTAADQIKMAMIEIDEFTKNTNIKMILQVHDELVFEVQGESKKEILMEDKKYKGVIETIEKIMMECAKLDVPMAVDVGFGKNWAELKS